MSEQLLPGMPPIAELDDYLERLVRDHPEWAGELMEGGQVTCLEWRFVIDRIQFPVAAQDLFGHWWRP